MNNQSLIFLFHSFFSFPWFFSVLHVSVSFSLLFSSLSFIFFLVMARDMVSKPHSADNDGSSWLVFLVLWDSTRSSTTESAKFPTRFRSMELRRLSIADSVFQLWRRSSAISEWFFLGYLELRKSDAIFQCTLGVLGDTEILHRIRHKCRHSIKIRAIRVVQVK